MAELPGRESVSKKTGHTGHSQIEKTGRMPRFSIVAPVLNEAARINELIDHVMNLEGSDECEIVVVDGDPAGGTIKAINSERVVKATSERGRAKQMNAGAALSRGEILVFLHADTELPRDGLAGISEAMSDRRFVGGAFEAGVDTDNLVIRFLAAASGVRNRLMRTPFGDQACFLRREYFEEIGGFKDIPFLEDVELMKRIRRREDRIRILRQRVRTSARRWEKEGIFITTLRNCFVLTLFGLGVSAHKLVRFYRNH